MIRKILTLRDAERTQAELEAILESDMIGELCRRGKPIYYAVIDGAVVEGSDRLSVAKAIQAKSAQS